MKEIFNFSYGLTTAFLLLVFCCAGYSQNANQQESVLFYRLNTSHGLSDNYIYSMCTDKSGNLWVGSGEGLNIFNGRSVRMFFKKDYPQLHNDHIQQLVCDNNNRVWVVTSGGHVTMIDENGVFHKVSLFQKGKPVTVTKILTIKNNNVLLFTNSGFYLNKPVVSYAKNDSLIISSFQKISIQGFSADSINAYTQAEEIKGDRYLFASEKQLAIINFNSCKIDTTLSLQGFHLLAYWRDNEMLVYKKAEQKLLSLDLTSGKARIAFDNVSDQEGQQFSGNASKALVSDNGEIWITTPGNGLYKYNNTSGKLNHFLHDASDPTTIANNAPTVIVKDASGWVFVGNTPNGVSYFKSNAVIGQQLIFTDKKGNAYDGYINNISTLNNNEYFLGVSDNLLFWNRQNNTTVFIADKFNYNLIKKHGVAYVTSDANKNLWVSVPSVGIYVLNTKFQLLNHIEVDSAIKKSLPSNYVRHLQMDPEGKFMWLSTRKGICRINIQSFELDLLDQYPFSGLKNQLCSRTWFSDTANIWIATEKTGAWHYNFLTKKLQQYAWEKNGISNNVFCFNKDQDNNIYIGTRDGLQILLNNGKIKIITQKDGLLHNRIEALLRDKENRMWIGNDVGLSCFSIADSSVRVFDERYGLSVQGFRLNAYHQNSDDELIWGTENGLQYFYPDKLSQQQITLKTTIHRVETRDLLLNTSASKSLDLASTDNYVSFYFSAVDYSKHLHTFYEYRLDGIDASWIKVTDQDFVRYTSLPAGKFTFKVRASNDGKLWIDASNTITINIAKTWWRQTWFKLLVLLLITMMAWYLFKYFKNKQGRHLEALETEVVINFFASQINSHQHTKEMLWDVAENCISKLNFEDCVIYLLNSDKDKLVQTAAYGPKSAIDFSINKPIEVSIGKGIVGTVALTGIAELIADTDKDNRYIVDDKKRYSEIAVPIMLDDEVIGVIDSEHSQKNFFTQKHLRVLKTVAILCANQMQRTIAEEEKQRARMELLVNKQKAVESRLQSLRLQMNPHFLFNALNSIQQMILANEEIVATKYLSKFSKLLRAVLIHSDKEAISLSEELEILNLYIELESIRFKNSFSHSIIVDENIETDEVKIPTLLIQPFVENAIWHGLMHKGDNRVLSITFTEQDDFIICSIEDNGIGRRKAAEMKVAAGNHKSHISKGIAVSGERLKTMSTIDGREGSIKITDLHDPQDIPRGTRVDIHFPIQN
ncbi:MAG: two-component regulator propeller domain-containing protein [Bacteroidota bacterium]